MTRYLTPARICTLVLIELYQSNDFWIYHANTCSVVLQLISRQCLQPTESTSSDVDILIAPPRNVLDFAAPLADLDAELPGRSWLSIIVRELWKIRTIDELHDIFGRCMQLIVTVEPQLDDVERPAMITRSSPIGQFIRRCDVEFTRLQFSDFMVLWQHFRIYRAPSRSLWIQQYPDAAQLAEADQVEQPPAILDDGILTGADTIDSILSASIMQLQKLGQRVPSEVKDRIRQWLATQGMSKAQSLRHFMSFFDSWRAGQYNLALENLHQYFDYSIAKSSGYDMKVYYQYALLHLSVLHADFEHWEESVSAMKECIATARENQDTACLNFALSWLLYLRQSRHNTDNESLRALASIAGEGGSERDELAFLKARARDSKHWALLSNTLLEEAKHELRHHGVSSKAVELVLQSSHVNIQHGSLSLASSTSVFQAAIFERLGQADLAHEHCSAAMHAYTQHSSLADRARIVCRLAYDAALQGRYDEGFAALRAFRTEAQGVLKLYQRLVAFTELLAFMRAIRRSDMPAADYHMSNLRPVRHIADPDVTRLIDKLEIEYMIRKKRADVALTKINTHIEYASAQSGRDVAEILSLLLMKANVFAQSQRSTKGFSIAVRVAAAAQQAYLLDLFTESLHTVAAILNELGEFDAARQLSEVALPRALEGNNAEVTAQLFVTLGESHVGMMGAVEETNRSRRVQIANAASAYIDRGLALYRQLEDYERQLDCLLMQATLARFADDDESAQQADAKYYQLVLEHSERR